jgi:hypothetical protein
MGVLALPSLSFVVVTTLEPLSSDRTRPGV